MMMMKMGSKAASPAAMIHLRRIASPSRRLSSSFMTEKRPSIVVRAWNAYSQSLHKRPLPTKCTAAALIFFASDSVTQYLMFPENEEFSWDALRALSGAAFGVIATSYLHLWWNGLEGVVERLWPVAKGKLGHTAVKVFIDQSMGAPMYIYSYYTVTNFLQALGGNKSAPEAWRGSRAKADQILWPTMLRHWKLWPVVHSFNFYFVPLHHRVLLQNMVLVGWSGYLSHLNNGGLLTPKEEVEITAKTSGLQRRQSMIPQAFSLMLEPEGK